MGRRGPKPLPTNIKLLHGTARKKDLQRNEPKPKPIAPKCPTWLSPEAKRKWKELKPELERLGIFTNIDGLTFSLAMTHYALARDAAMILKQEGSMTVDERGLPRKHPANQILRDHSQAFKQYMAEFGLSPASRTRLDTEEEEDNEFERFLRRCRT